MTIDPVTSPHPMCSDRRSRWKRCPVTSRPAATTITNYNEQEQQQQQQPFNGLFSRTTRVRRYQKGKTNLDFTGARDSEWQWHHLGHMQVCTSLQTDNHASSPPLCFLQAGCPSCRPTNSVKALKAQALKAHTTNKNTKNISATKITRWVSIMIRRRK